jgi:hypothetical protein
MAKPYVTTTTLAAALGLNPKTVRRAYDAAEQRSNAGEPRARGDEALLKGTSTPGGWLRWSLADACQVALVFGKTPPAEWLSPSERAEQAVAARGGLDAVAEDLGRVVTGGAG